MSERKDAQRLDAAIAELLRGVPIETVLAESEADLAPYLRLFGQLQAAPPPVEGPPEEFRLRLRARFVQGANREARLDRGRGSRFQRAAVASAASLILGSALNPTLAHELVNHVRDTMGRAAADVLSAALFTERRSQGEQSLPHTPLGEEASPAPAQSHQNGAGESEQFVPASQAISGENGTADTVPGTPPGIVDTKQTAPDGGQSEQAPGNEPALSVESPPAQANAPRIDGDPIGNVVPAASKIPDQAVSNGTGAPPNDDTVPNPSATEESAPETTAAGAPEPAEAQQAVAEQPVAEPSGAGFDPADGSAANEGPPGLDGELPPGHGGPRPGNGAGNNGHYPPEHSAASNGPPGLEGEVPPGHGGPAPTTSQGNGGNGTPAHSSASDGPPGLVKAASADGVDVPQVVQEKAKPEQSQSQSPPAEPSQVNKPESPGKPEAAGHPEHAQASNPETHGQPEQAQAKQPATPGSADNADGPVKGDAASKKTGLPSGGTKGD